MKKAYETDFGICYQGKVENILKGKRFGKYKGKINLIFTSPPFPLNRKKKYGNLQGELYVRWFSNLGKLFKEYLTDDGSIVIEVGNSWEKGSPTMSTLAMESLLGFLKIGDYNLCQQFIWNNPAKLPSPAQWVNVERIRVKDAFTHIWWMSREEKPKANNKNVLVEYSDSMKQLLKTKKYNSGIRPSEHNIGKESFLKNNTGAIPSNVITASNTRSNTDYQEYCRAYDLQPHPARMPEEIVKFFVKFLTDEGDLVFDPFAGSNTTGAVSEKLSRNWLATELNKDYIKGSKGRFKKLY